MHLSKKFIELGLKQVAVRILKRNFLRHILISCHFIQISLDLINEQPTMKSFQKSLRQCTQTGNWATFRDRTQSPYLYASVTAGVSHLARNMLKISSVGLIRTIVELSISKSSKMNSHRYYSKTSMVRIAQSSQLFSSFV